MDVIIPLPQNSSASTYKELKGYLKQLELAIHHAQKSVESAEQSGIELSEDTFVVFEHPTLESSCAWMKKMDYQLPQQTSWIIIMMSCRM